MTKPIRRVVTGHDARGRSIFLAMGPRRTCSRSPAAPTSRSRTSGSPIARPPRTRATPTPPSGRSCSSPRRRGAIFRILVQFPPDRAPGGFDRKAAFAAMGAHHAMDPDASRHPGMHKTDTVDFALVLAEYSGP